MGAISKFTSSAKINLIQTFHKFILSLSLSYVRGVQKNDNINNLCFLYLYMSGISKVGGGLGLRPPTPKVALPPRKHISRNDYCIFVWWNKKTMTN